jgi:hypothetical protein
MNPPVQLTYGNKMLKRQTKMNVNSYFLISFLLSVLCEIFLLPWHLLQLRDLFFCCVRFVPILLTSPSHYMLVNFQYFELSTVDSFVYSVIVGWLVGWFLAVGEV